MAHHAVSVRALGVWTFAALISASQLCAQELPSSAPSAQSSTAPANSSAPPAATPQLPDTPSTSGTGSRAQSTGSTLQSSPQTRQPSGTAAAQSGTLSGTALSRPAGVAIAPARQKRSRSLVIKLGLIAGVGVALGTVAALSAAGGGKPPGAQ